MVADYGEGAVIPHGLLAKKNSQPMSIFKFVLINGVLFAISMFVLNKRKTAILNEAYSKLSIFKK